MNRLKSMLSRKRALRGLLVALAVFVVAGLTYAAVNKSGVAGGSQRGSQRGAQSQAQGAVSTRVDALGEPRTVAARAVHAAAAIESTGNLEAWQSVDLGFSSAGKLLSVDARVGQKVGKGDVLARLDDSQARYQLANVEAQLQSAKISGSARQIELLTLERALRAADLDSSLLRAPFSGVVSSVSAKAGESLGSSAKVLRLIDRFSLKAVLGIDEIDLPSVKLGQKVEFKLDAFPDKKYEGRVSLIPQEGTVTSQGLAVFSVEAEIPTPPDELKPGYSFVAAIIPSDTRNVVSIPSTALLEQNGAFYVLVYSEDLKRSERRSVTATRKDDGTAQVSFGLSAGELVTIPETQSGGSQRGGGFFVPGLGGAPPTGGFQRNSGSGSQRSAPASGRQTGGSSGGAISGARP